MGRPRSDRAHAQVLDAAGQLFAEHGIDGTSMDAIAAASGVSKATIYKHWPDKDALCLEVMATLHGADRPTFASSDVRDDILRVLEFQPPKPTAELKSRIMPHLMAHAARNPSFGIAWRARIIEPVRSQLTHLLRRAIVEKRLSPGVDLEVAVASLIGPMMYGNFLRLMGATLPENLAEQIVAAFWRAYGKDKGIGGLKGRRGISSACGPSAARSRRARARGGGAPRALMKDDRTRDKTQARASRLRRARPPHRGSDRSARQRAGSAWHPRLAAARGKPAVACW
jgi:AcrR family transcriptional regulator